MVRLQPPPVPPPPDPTRPAGRRTATPGWIATAALATPVLATILGLLLAGATVVVFALVTTDENSRATEGSALAAILVFFAAWIAWSLIASVVVAMLIGRMRDMAGRSRFAVTAGLATWAPIAIAAGLAMAWFANRSGLAWIGIPLGLTVGAAAVAVLARPSVVAPVGGALAVIVVGAVALAALAENSHRSGIYEGTVMPVGLIDEDALTGPFAGWRVIGYKDREALWWRGPYAVAELSRPDGSTHDITFSPFDDGHRAADPPICLSSGSCELLEPLPDGSVVTQQILGTCGRTSVPSGRSVTAHRVDGTWTTSSHPGCGGDEPMAAAQLRALLATVRPVPLDEWISAT